MPGVTWCCAQCRSTGTAVNKRQSIIVPEDDVDSSPSSLSLLKDIQMDVKLLSDKYETILNSINFCSDAITAFELNLAKLNEKACMIEKLTKENIELKTTVKDLNNKLENVEQHIRANNIEIYGIPQRDNENIINIIRTVANNIGSPLEASDIDTAFRVPTSEHSKPKPIVVKFLCKQKRDAILAAYKAKRRSENSNNGLKIENISNELYINEHLTHNNKVLLRKSKEAARRNNFKYVWVRDGTVFVRKGDTSRAFKILKEEDISRIK